MAIEIKWVVNSLPAAPSEDGMTDVVKSISWTRLATQTVGEGESAKTYTAGFPGVTPLATPTAENFIPYGEITESQVGVYFSEALNYSDNRQEFNIFRNEDPTYVVRLFDFLSSQAKNLGSSKSYNKIRANIGNRFNF